MANDEHVAMLKKGVTAWNKWCRENRRIRPDLRGADLSNANLVMARLLEADLPILELLPPPPFRERRHRGLARRLVAVCRRADWPT